MSLLVDDDVDAVSARPRRDIVRIAFDVLDDDALVDQSVVEVTTPLTWDYERAQPVPHGPLDRRLGALSSAPAYACATCEGTLNVRAASRVAFECTGHFGHVRLARPVFTTITIDLVAHLMRAFCIHCGALTCWGARRRALVRRVCEARARNDGTLVDYVRALADEASRAGVCRPDDDDETYVRARARARTRCTHAQ